jgi:ABC-type transport system involved in multi-copper enzyme maturation permease subunit
MLRALAWKEWREQRPLVIAGVALAATMPVMLFTVATATMQGFSSSRLADLTVLAFALLMWPMFAAAAGAGTFANESSGRTFGFLLSRPVARRNIWVAKVALAALATTAVIAASWAVANVVSWLAGKPGAADPSLAVFGGAFTVIENPVLGPVGLYLCFSAAVFLSARVGRPLAATIGALAITMFTLIMLIALWPRVGLIRSFQGTWTAAEALVAATLLLVLSLRRFTSGEAGTASSLARTLSSAALVMVLTAAAGFAPAVYADVFADLDRVVTRDFALSPSGDAAVVTGAQYPSVMGSLWRLPDEAQRAGGGTEQRASLRLTRRLAFSPFFSPDGEWVYYFTARGLLGTVSGDVDLRAVRIDGTEDRQVIDNMGEVRDATRQGWPRPARESAASPDGSRVVFGQGWWGEGAMAIDLEQGTARKIVDPVVAGDLEFIWQTGEPIAWSGDDEVVFHVRAWGPNRDLYHAIVAYDIAADRGAPRFALRRSNADFSWPFAFPSVVFGPYLPGSRLPVQVLDFTRSGRSGDYFYELDVVDTNTGEFENIEDFPCGHPGAAVSADGNVVAHRRFASCVRAENGDLEGVDPVLVIRDLQTGSVEEISDWGDPVPGKRLRYIGVSPSGSRVSLYVGQERGATVFKIVEADRTVRTMNVRHFFGAALLSPSSAPRWIDEDHMMVRYSARRSSQYLRFAAAAVLDVNDGSVVHEFIIPYTSGTIY